MSMLSAQADKLRRVADLYDGKTQPPIAKELQRPALAQELRDAADTILSLRGRAQGLQTENAKLREIASDLYSLVMHEDIYVRYPLSDEFDKIMNQIETSMRELGIEVK